MIPFILFTCIVLSIIYFFVKGRKITTDDFTIDIPFLNREVLFFANLNESQKKQFITDLKDFLKEIKITGVHTAITNEDRLLVASGAIIPVFNFPGWKYRNLTEVLLYANTFNKEFESEGNNERNILGMVGNGYLEGKMLLSQQALHESFLNHTDKRNTVIHEFAHLIDKADGDTNGVPLVLMQQQYVIPWLDMIHTEMEKIKTGHSDIDPYAYTNKTEFFAVVSEYFFERPDLLEQHHPQLFKLMQQMFEGTHKKTG